MPRRRDGRVRLRLHRVRPNEICGHAGHGPFWRAKDGRGIIVKTLGEKPPVFDPIMWVHGAPMGPSSENGPLVDRRAVRRLDQLLQGNFFTFAVWVN